MLNLLPLGNTQCGKHGNQTFRAEQSHQIILQGNVEFGLTGVSLTSASTTQLIIDTSGLVTLRTDNLQSACRLRLCIQLNIRTTACHVGSDGNCPMNTRICYNLRLQLMELRIQHLMLDAALVQHSAQLFTGFNGNGTNQHRLSLRMCLLHCIHNCIQLLRFCFIYCILMIDTCYRFVGGNLHNIHSVNLTELILLCQCGTGHTTFLFKQVKEVLEGNGSQSLTLALHLYMLLCLDCLMQTIGITTAGHNTSGKLIHD